MWKSHATLVGNLKRSIGSPSRSVSSDIIGKTELSKTGPLKERAVPVVSADSALQAVVAQATS
jgi:hypothetical protein